MEQDPYVQYSYFILDILPDKIRQEKKIRGFKKLKENILNGGVTFSPEKPTFNG